MVDPQKRLLRCRSLFATLAVAGAMIAGGCNLILEPIEQRFLFRVRSVDPAYLNTIASRERGIEEVRLKTSDGVTLHGWLKHPVAPRPTRRFPISS